jgi:hypothetical protein
MEQYTRPNNRVSNSTIRKPAAAPDAITVKLIMEGINCRPWIWWIHETGMDSLKSRKMTGRA